jgi:FkbM family methyltransferase
MRIGLKHNALRVFGHQHYILHGRDWVIRMLYPPEKSQSIPFEVPFFGMRYPGNLNSLLDWSVFFYGAYCRNELYILRDVAAVLRKEQSRPFSFYDVGANIGHHSLFMAPRVDRVFAFEPFETVRAKIHEKIERNRLTNVTVFPVGFGDADAELDFFEPKGANGGAGTFMAGPGAPSRNVRKLSVRRGDDFCEGRGLPPLDLLKMDVEGFEIRVLRGLKERIRQDRPVILMEVSDQTRAEMKSEDEFRKCLYENARVFEVGCVSISSSYRLKSFRFSTSGEILVVPEEKLPTLEGIIPAARRF